MRRVSERYPPFLSNGTMTEPTVTPVPTEQDDAADKSKRLTGREYAVAKTMWQSGEYSLSEISEEVGVSATALSRRFKRDSVVKGSDNAKVAAAVKKAIEKTSAAQAEELSQTAHDIKMLALKSIKLFSQKTYADVALAIQAKQPLGEKLNDFKALEIASKIVAQNYATGARILGLDQDLNPEDDLPELQIQIMTENDVAELREAQRQEEREASGEYDDVDDEIMAALSVEELKELDDEIDANILEEGPEERVI